MSQPFNHSMFSLLHKHPVSVGGQGELLQFTCRFCRKILGKVSGNLFRQHTSLLFSCEIQYHHHLPVSLFPFISKNVAFVIVVQYPESTAVNTGFQSRAVAFQVVQLAIKSRQLRLQIPVNRILSKTATAYLIRLPVRNTTTAFPVPYKP